MASLLENEVACIIHYHVYEQNSIESIVRADDWRTELPLIIASNGFRQEGRYFRPISQKLLLSKLFSLLD